MGCYNIRLRCCSIHGRPSIKIKRPTRVFVAADETAVVVAVVPVVVAAIVVVVGNMMFAVHEAKV